MTVRHISVTGNCVLGKDPQQLQTILFVMMIRGEHPSLCTSYLAGVEALRTLSRLSWGHEL